MSAGQRKTSLSQPLVFAHRLSCVKGVDVASIAKSKAYLKSSEKPLFLMLSAAGCILSSDCTSAHKETWSGTITAIIHFVNVICFACGSGLEPFYDVVCRTKAILANGGHVSCVGRSPGASMLPASHLFL